MNKLKKRILNWLFRKEAPVILTKLFGVNYKTTMGGWGMILGGIAGLIHCFTGAHPDMSVTGQAIPSDPVGCIAASVASIGGGWGLIHGKDAKVVGAGDDAVRVP